MQQFVLLLKALTQDRGLHQLEVHFWEEVDSLNKDAGSLTELSFVPIRSSQNRAANSSGLPTQVLKHTFNNKMKSSLID